MDYRREIDGLRALAVLPVILFHAGFETFSGGFVGVDVFFVISGYLITTIILAELEQGKFSIVNFYERRARRILPALFLVMLVCIPFAWFWLLPSDMKDFSQSLVAVSVFASNILFWRESGYFDTAAELKPLLHTWSLAVEEQYYVLLPLFLMLFWKFGKRWILVMLALVFAASLFVAQWAAYAKPAAAFYLLPTRGWELLIGAFAAFYLSQANRKDFSRGLSEAAGWLGVVLIMHAVFAYSKTTPFPGFYAFVPTIGAVLIILFATQQTSVGKFVGNKAFVGVGLISYSAYLWHQPLFSFYRHLFFLEDSKVIYALLACVAFIFAYFSWRFVEQPFRDRKTLGPRQYKIILVVPILLVLSFGLIGSLNGYQSRFSHSNSIYGDMLYYRKEYWDDYSRFVNVKGTLPSKFPENKKNNVLVIGNSWAHDIAVSLSSSSKLNVAYEGMTGHRCNEFICTDVKSGEQEYDNWVMRCSNNAKRFLNIPSGTDIVVLADHLYEVGQYDDKLIKDAFLSNLTSIRKKYSGDIVVIKGRPTWKMDGYRIAERLKEVSEKSNLSAQRFLKKSSVSLKLIDDYYRNFYSIYDVRYLSLTEALCDADGLCRLFSDSKVLYFDSSHLTLDGSLFVSGFLRKKLFDGFKGKEQ